MPSLVFVHQQVMGSSYLTKFICIRCFAMSKESHVLGFLSYKASSVVFQWLKLSSTRVYHHCHHSHVGVQVCQPQNTQPLSLSTIVDENNSSATQNFSFIISSFEPSYSLWQSEQIFLCECIVHPQPHTPTKTWWSLNACHLKQRPENLLTFKFFAHCWCL